MPNDHEQRDECRDNFRRLWERLEKGDDTMKEHDIGLAELRTNVTNLTKSMDALTKSIWGAAVTAATLGVGFIIWFIQQQ